MTNPSERDKLASEWWDKLNTGMGVSLHATSIFKAGFDAGQAHERANEIHWESQAKASMRRVQELGQERDSLLAENDRLTTMLEGAQKSLEHWVGEAESLESMCDKLAKENHRLKVGQEYDTHCFQEAKEEVILLRAKMERIKESEARADAAHGDILIECDSLKREVERLESEVSRLRSGAK